MPHTPTPPASHGEPMANPHSGDRRSRLPLWGQRALGAAFLALVAASAVFAVSEHWRRATVALGVAMLWLAGCRITCDDRVIGFFSVRSRRFDAGFCGAVGAARVALAASVDARGS